MRRSILWALAGSLLLTAAGASEVGPQDPPRFEIRLVGPSGEDGRALRLAVNDDLSRTRRRHDMVAVALPDSAGVEDMSRILALLELRFDASVARPTIEPARGDDEVSPGWLVHALLRAGETVGVEPAMVDSRSSWLGQLVQRSTRSSAPGAADEAVVRGVPAVTLLLPEANEPAVRLVASFVRRLDGLDSYPVFEDEYLVAGGRVLLRRDLYWLGLLVWLALYWRGRKQPGREFRWLVLAAWLVAPVHASLLLLLPALVATWRPIWRWPAAAALLPVVAFVALLALAIAGSEALHVSGIPALLVLLALAAFVWQHLIHPAGREEVAIPQNAPDPAV